MIRIPLDLLQRIVEATPLDPAPDHADVTTPSEATTEESTNGRSDNQRALAALAQPSPTFDAFELRDRVVIMLLYNQVVNEEQVKRAWKRWQDGRQDQGLWRVLAETPEVETERVYAEAAWIYGFEQIEIAKADVLPLLRSASELFEESLWEDMIQHPMIPVGWERHPSTNKRQLLLATYDPTRPSLKVLMNRFRVGSFAVRYAPKSVLDDIIQEAFPRRNEYLDRLSDDAAFDLGMAYQQEKASELVDEDALEAEISRSKLINLFEATLIEAVRQGASDVHIWPNARKQIEIHFRLDGRLQRWHLEDKVHPEALIAVIKDNAMNVDRFERDAAQDGFIQRWIDEALIRFRVSVLPIANAASDVRSESIVIRVLDDRKVVKDLSLLGLNRLALDRFEKAIHQPHGMVILTGPTGSGKTTTLYAALHEVVSPEVNVLTVEDPVEYILPGVRQIKLNHKLGLESALRSILRHDPDVVMVGEMRDRDTAELAIKLANTGHLTFSTLHTNDAASAISRLYKMGIEPFLIAYAINLVVAQRLIRMVCPRCKEVDRDPDLVLLKNLGFSEEQLVRIESGAFKIYGPGRDDNCPTCRGVGYKGRRAVSEALYFSRGVRHMIADAAEGNLDEQGVKALAQSEGMLTLADSARAVVEAGETTIREMLRVVSTDD